jgi:octaprenyl-diphosphate synthase
MSALLNPSFSRHTMDLNSIRALVATDLSLFNELLTNDYSSTVPLINAISEYIIQCGGKHLRPLVLLLMANAFNYRGDAAAHLATAVEFMHTASLLHDDVIDESTMRRGRKTVNAQWNNPSSVLVGDFLYSRAFQKISNLVDVKLIDILRALANATNQLVEGEVIQLINRRNARITEEVYFNIIHFKTGKLFEVAAHFGSLLGDADPTLQQAASNYGKHLGIAFQLMDDILDYSADPKKLGKNLGDDLAEGSPTLPIIYALQYAEEAERLMIQEAIETGSLQNLTAIIQIVEKSGAITYTKELAAKQVELALLALETLPASEFRTGLAALATFAIQREY